MKFFSLSIVPFIFAALAGLITVGCSQTAAPDAAEKPLVKPSATGSAMSSNTSPSPEPSPIAETTPEPKPVHVLKKPLKENSQDERPDDSKLKSTTNRSLLFSCTTDNGKEILLYQTDETIDYSFGDPGRKPDLDLQVPHGQASTWQWKGIGRAMTYAVDVPNGDTNYSVFWSVDRLSETKAVEAGVRVHSNRKTLATVYCVDKIVNNLQGVQLKPTEY